MTSKNSSIDQVTEDVDVVVIGAGFAGMYMTHRLRDAGFRVHGYEAGSDVGGVWYWNRYPGARCDSESLYYSYSFLEDVEQSWPIQERYPKQPEILRYLNHVADRIDIRKHFSFNTRIASLVFDDPANQWIVTTESGQVQRCQWVVTAVGCLSKPIEPSFPGEDTFAGLLLYTSRWPHEPVDFSGQRVGVVGTGSSGIQIIPAVAQTAAHLTVFQRTAQFTLPAANAILPPDFVAMWKANYREWRRRGRESVAGAPSPSPCISAFDVTDEQRAAAYEASWEQGGYVFASGTFNDVLTNEAANDTAADFVRAKIDAIVRDQRIADRLKPYGYPIATKRIPLDSDYYATFNRPNVELVDIKQTPIEQIVATGVQTTEELHELDMLIYATGFDAITGPLLAIDIRGQDGVRLADEWKDGPLTYMGLSIPGFPNLFTITGPGSPSVLGCVPVTIEQNVEWIDGFLAWASARGVTRIEPSRSSAQEWTTHVQELADKTLYPHTASWYTGGNIDGKPRVFLPYVGGYNGFRNKCDEVAGQSYAGFDLHHRVAAR
jgi:cation diffusion facilitator CzcD-associated flavoprotein CzcO